MKPRRRKPPTLFSNPFANGLVALVVGLLVMYVSYNANNGIPGTPTYKVSVDVPDAGQLVKHADVRVGGTRVGQVLEIKAMPRTRAHAPYARLKLAIRPSLKPLAVDSRSEVRVASVLGGKYVSLVPGRSARKLGDGQALALARSRAAVDLDQAFRVLDPPTRRALGASIIELGNAFAGRGTDVNAAIGSFAAATGPLQRVLARLAAPRTNLGGFLEGAAAAVSALAPVSRQLADTLGHGATTLDALDRAGDSLGDAIDALPGAESQSTTTLRHLQPAISSAAALSRELRPAADVLPGSARRLAALLKVATPVARQAPTLADPLRGVFTNLQTFAKDPSARTALVALGANDLATTGASGFIGLGAILRAVEPAQLSCNVAGVWLRNLASIVSNGDASGSVLRLGLVLDPPQMVHVAKPAADLHVNALPHENAAECEAGNEPYTPGVQAIGNPAGNQSTTTELTANPPSVRARLRGVGR